MHAGGKTAIFGQTAKQNFVKIKNSDIIYSIYKYPIIGNTYLILRVLRKYPMNIQVNKEEDTDIFSVRFVSLTERDLFATGKKYATIKEKRSVSLSCQNVVGILNFIHFPKDYFL